MLYDQNCYSGQSDQSRSSASIVVPIIARAIRPKSMVDIGCGLGSWAQTFADLGSKIAHGVDGPWVVETDLVISKNSFFRYDFEKAKPPLHSGHCPSVCFRPKTDIAWS